MKFHEGNTVSILDGYRFALDLLQAPAYIIGPGPRLLHANPHAHANGDPSDDGCLRQLVEWTRPCAAPTGIAIRHIQDKAFEGTILIDFSGSIDLEVPARGFAKDYSFTAAQTEVFVRWVCGRSAPGIASELGCTEETVRSHLKQIRERAGVSAKFDLIELVRRRGGR